MANMRKKIKLFFVILTSLIVVASGIFLIYAVYSFLNWNKKIFWISFIASCWSINTIVTIYNFYSKKELDEEKTFWTIIIYLFPICGILWFFAYRRKIDLASKKDSDQTKLLSNIYCAKKSILICSNSFLVSDDVFAAINFAYYKKINIQILLLQNNFQQYKISKFLNSSINVKYFSKKINKSFIIIDNEFCLIFNSDIKFKNLYFHQQLKVDPNINKYLYEFKTYNNNAQPIQLKKHFFSSIYFRIMNFLYIFL